MWRIIWRSLLVVGLALAVRPAVAQAWSITDFTATIDVRSDASIDVSETIRVDFDTPKHGIFRNIPWHYDTNDGNNVRVPIDVHSVSMDGRKIRYQTTTSASEVSLKIGDPDATITGVHEYLITYTAQAAVNYFSDHEELYWNVTGNNWEVPIDQTNASVTLPQDVDPTNLRLGCFTGTLGSRAQDCTSAPTQNGATYSANDFLTVVLGWPNGIVPKPSDYETIRQTAGADDWTKRFLSPFVLGANGLLILAGVLGLPLLWGKFGRDPKSRGTVIAQYEPPDSLRPGELGVVMNERADHADMTATIIDLAVRGYLEITEEKKDRFLGIGESTDYRLDRRNPAHGGKLHPYEQHILNALFDGETPVRLSERKVKMYAEIKQAEQALYQQVATDGYFNKNPQRTRWTFAGLGIALTVTGFWAVPLGIIALPFIGLLLLIVAPFMPRRTAKGVDALWHARGFKLFLEKAEKYRIKWQEKEHIFEEFLPYAMVFGVAEKWSNAFKGIEQAPPDWYHGSPGSAFNSIVLWSALNNFSSVSTRSFAPPAASGSSGFGGGGFSGGGFGGGGGGSW